MKRLSELVAIKNGLDNLTTNTLRQTLETELEHITSKISDPAVLLEKQQEIIKAIDNFDYEYHLYQDNLQASITEREKEYFELSYQIYEGSKRDSTEYIFERNRARPINNRDEYRKRISIYSSWKFPGLYIRPGANKTVDEMIACDPLYIVDHSYDLLEPVKQLWTKNFQSRVRYSVIDDDNDEIFKNLPHKQFGLIVASDFFDYKPFEVLKKYLQQMKELLRPGGVIIFTYNNCDLFGPVRNVENFFNTYIPGSLLERVVEGLGFELINSNVAISGYNWMEIRNPGNQTSLRGGQALAAIKDSRLDHILPDGTIVRKTPKQIQENEREQKKIKNSKK